MRPKMAIQGYEDLVVRFAAVFEYARSLNLIREGRSQQPRRRPDSRKSVLRQTTLNLFNQEKLPQPASISRNFKPLETRITSCKSSPLAGRCDYAI